MHNNIIELCSLCHEESVEVYLRKYFKASRQKIKKSFLGKNKLKKEVRIGDILSVPYDLLNPYQINPHYSGSKVEIIEKESKTLVLSKPSFCHIHPLSYDDSNNLLSFVRASHLYSFLKTKLESYDRSLLYRLDYETSGLVILSSILSREDIVSKNYLAVVDGRIEVESIELVDLLTTTGTKVKISAQGMESRCHIVKMGYCEKENKTLVSVFLKEGRRHQIRVQLANFGHPITGDVLYGGQEEKRFFGLHSFVYEVGDKRFIDKNVPFKDLFLRFSNLDSYLEVFSDKFRIFQGR